MSFHFAHQVYFDQLHENLEKEVQNGNVNRQSNGDLHLYCYSKTCVFDRAWNDYTCVARGLILDVKHKKIVATPFPKFFNVGEHSNLIPNEPFISYEKLDGSLIIAFYYNGEWHTATKGSFFSEQAQWAKKQLQPYEEHLDQNVTYLFEAIYPENRIVVKYDYEGLVLLGAYDNQDGKEIPLWAMQGGLPFRAAKTYDMKSLESLLEEAQSLSANEEGWVIRFASGLRLKVKGAEYKRIHAMVSRLSPLSVWESMKNEDDLTLFRKDLPEEFWGDFDQIVMLLENKLEALASKIKRLADECKDLSDKEVGLRLNTFPQPEAKYLFAFRKAPERLSKGLFSEVRPTGNKLEDYRPSFATHQIQNEY